MQIFPKNFETSVYTEQETICPSSISLPPCNGYRPTVPRDFDSRRFAQLFRAVVIPLPENLKRGRDDEDDEDEQPAAKRRRKVDKVRFHCTVPGCSDTLASKQRVESHVKAVHNGIRDLPCGAPGCPYMASVSGTVTKHRNKHCKYRAR
ncbi:hypothetical protein BYT27DRAFT_7246056 [Phlegmacium glaucopus]|nr:hypothetical protein BYT27DRAFT_7246056 [Phlegmacium glaucopus]